MSDRKNALDILRNNGFGLFPQGFFSNYFDDNLWNTLGLGDIKVDIREKKDSYIIDAEMPGIDKDNVQIDINDHLLTISAQINEQSEQKDENGHYLRRERRTGSFRRSFSLDHVKADEIKAEMKNGILTIICPKKPEATGSSRIINID